MVPKDCEEDGGARAALIDLDRHARIDMPGECPALDLDAALWAARSLFKACYLMANREIESGVIASGEDGPEPTPEAAYSVDLSFRFLPDLAALVSQASEADPLGQVLLGWGRRWPFSSVGMKLGGADLDHVAIAASASLRLSYADRIIAKKDTSRLGDRWVAGLVRGALGAYPDLCPEIAAALAAQASTEDDRHHDK